ncbi:CheR family methyltransferase [Tunicatimonas pelagia]|uniref:CheR family methyltransferase n=1 Tax=Tunicatimonas pelagia TaxID=931531 RepID=UPI0026662934|nr:CheR family methyltransferase [Tunicatimonas pelagia]WKN40796.1 CheR family methyltransferase [Tunicatimonas pelagia]
MGDDHLKDSDKLYVVGVGASAGGLDALSKLVDNLPAKPTNFAIIVAQHLSPDYKSRMVELLNRNSRWPIAEAQDQLPIETGTVYITPPDYEISVEDRSIILKKIQQKVHAVPSIDNLLQSIAAEFKNYAIGVILSGTGEDGTLGIREIKKNKGYTIAQEPSTSQHRSMPETAIKTGYVDVVLPPVQIGYELGRFIQNHQVVNGVEEKESSTESIFRLMTSKTGTDFSKYKSSTIQRRITKRLDALDLLNIDDYYRYIQENPTELDNLFQTVLIGVTEFFRDQVAFNTLEKYLKEIVTKKKRGEPIRIWSVGCATGEEPYSIAILLFEILGKDIHNNTVQIFATDIDENALVVGRRGAYSEEQVANLSPDLLEEYFNQGVDGYEIKKKIRQLVLFSKHDITVDPPFVRLDLVTCRNVLIYFRNELQKEVLPVFHYALNENAYLMLGKSENILQLTDLFLKEDNKQKIFRRKSGTHLNTLKYTNFKKSRDKSESAPPSKTELSLEEIARETLIQTYEHPYVVIDDTLEVLLIKGRMAPYVDLSEGSLNASILKIVHRGLHLGLRTTITRAKREGTPQKSSIIRFTTYQQEETVRLTVKSLLYRKNDQSYYLVIFEKIDPDVGYPLSLDEVKAQDEYKNAVRVMELEQELAATREHLQTFTEELETTNEELQTMNEELQSSNEELKSANEELETSNEELQSANEELQTANAELAISNENLVEKEAEISQIKGELEESNDRFKLALENSPIIIFYQNTDLQYIWQCNSHPDYPIDNVLGKTDDELLGKDYQKFIDLKRQVLIDKQSVRAEMRLGSYDYDVFIQPIFTHDKVVGIKGVAIDITEKKKAQRQAAYRQSIINNTIYELDILVLVVDPNFEVLALNRTQWEAFQNIFQKDVKEGDNVLKLLEDFPDAQAKTRNMFDTAFEGKRTTVTGYESTRITELGDPRFHDITVMPIHGEDGTVVGAVMSSQEITQKRKREQQLQGIVRQSANLTGEEFFKDLTQQIAELFRIKYVYIGILSSNETEVETKALRVDGKLAKDFAYGLQGVPCAAVARNEDVRYFENVSQQFPEDPKLQRWNAESYLGVPITSPSTGETLGILVMINDQPWQETPDTDYLLNVLSLRAGAELDRQANERRIRKRDRQIKRITESIPEMIYEYVIYPDGSDTFTYVSAASEQIYELKPEAITKNADLAYQAIHPDDINSFAASSQRAAENLEVNAWEGRIISAKTNLIKWVKITSVPEKKNNGNIVWTGVVDDITHYKSIEKQLRKAKEDAEQAVKVKEEFLATMSHEIRTPLNAIIGIADLLLIQNPQSAQQDNLQTLKFSSQSLMALINDILDFSKIEAGKVEVTRAPFNFHRFIHSLIRAHEAQAQKNQNQLILEQDEDVPEVIVCDHNKLNQILNNLLSNAIKFTHQGTVTLRINVVESSSTMVTLYFAVIDTGVGIAPDRLDNVFNSFTQEDSSTSRNFGGTGLGLTITRMLLQLKGSQIHVKSEPGKGSTFFFTLSFAIGELEEATIHNTQNPNVGLAKIKQLLLVEDAPVNRMVVVQYLQEWWNIAIDEASNGEEAVNKAKQTIYDIILMDIRMPVMDGVKAAKQIRALSNGNEKTPIIALTADITEINRQSANDYFDDYVAKPFDPSELQNKIIKHTQQFSQSTDEAVNVPEVEDIFIKDPQRLDTFYELALSSFTDHKATIIKALETKDAELLQATIHTMQPTLIMLSAEHVLGFLREAKEKIRSTEVSNEVSNGVSDAFIHQVEEELNKLIQQLQERRNNYPKN